MRTYTVHHRLNDARDLVREVEGLEFVKEGFCWPGMLVPLLWFLFRGMWLVLIIYLAAMIAVAVAGDIVGLPQDVVITLALATNLIVGFEGNDLRRWTLERSGWRTVGIVSGHRRSDAERRFLATLTDGSYRAPPAPPASRPPSAAPSRPRTGTWAHPDTEDDVVGLFPSPERSR